MHEAPSAVPPVPVELLAEVARATSPGVARALTGAELNVNLVVLLAGSHITTHVNDAVEVLIVVLAGRGFAELDGARRDMAPGDALVIPRGTRRALGPASERFAYLTCHRRRPPLTVTRRGGEATGR